MQTTAAAELRVFQAGWELNGWNKVIAHETLHLFGAPDEYGGDGTPCTGCGGSWGVFNVPNGNCAACANPKHKCLMDENDSELCDYTRAQIGWSDVLVEVTTDPTSQDNNDPMWIKLGNGKMYRLSDPVHNDRVPGAADPYALGYTRLTQADIETLAVGNDDPSQIKTPWKVKRIRLWVQGALIYDHDDIGGVVSADRSWLLAPGFPHATDIVGYTVVVTTGDKWFAGTEDTVWLTLGGKEMILNDFVTIDDPPYGGYTGFQTGVKSRLMAPNGIDVSANRAVIIRKSTAGLFAQFGGDDWYLEHLKITATRRNGSEVVILDQAVNQWIGLPNLTWTGTLTAVP